MFFKSDKIKSCFYHFQVLRKIKKNSKNFGLYVCIAYKKAFFGEICFLVISQNVYGPFGIIHTYGKTYSGYSNRNSIPLNKKRTISAVCSK